MTDNNNNTDKTQVTGIDADFPQLLLSYMEQLMVDNGYSSTNVNDITTYNPVAFSGSYAVRQASSSCTEAVNSYVAPGLEGDNRVLEPKSVLEPKQVKEVSVNDISTGKPAVLSGSDAVELPSSSCKGTVKTYAMAVSEREKRVLEAKKGKEFHKKGNGDHTRSDH